MLQKLLFDSFSLGLNKQGEDGTLGRNVSAGDSIVRTDEYRVGKNLRTNTGGLKLVGGIQNLFASRAGTVTGFTRFITPSGVSYIVFGQSDGSTHTVYAYNESTGVFTDLGSSFALGVRTDFLATDAYLYVAYPSTGSAAVKVWDGNTANDLMPAGVPTPPSIPVVDSLVAAGNLDGEYEYVYTFENSRGLESNPSPIGIPFTANNESTVIHSLAYTPDTGMVISWVNFYRRNTSTMEVALYAGRSAFVSGTDVSFADNTADDDLTARSAPSNHGPIPLGVQGLFLYDNRMWAFKNNSIYYSTKGEYEAFTEYTEARDLDGGILELDTPNGNEVVGFSSTGSVLIIGTLLSVHSIMWDGEAYRARQESNQGVLSYRCICRGDNHVYYMGRDFQVYRLGDAEGVILTEKIRDYLATVTPYVYTYFRAGTIEYHDRHIVFMHPRGMFRINVDTGIIEDLNDALYDAMELRSLMPAGGGKRQLYMAPYSGYSGASVYTDVGGSAYRGIVEILNTNLAVSIPVQYRSDKMDHGFPLFRKRCNRLQLFGTITQGTPAVSVNLHLTTQTDAGPILVTKNIPLTGTSGILLDTGTLPFTYTYHEIEIEFIGKASALDIRKMIYTFVTLEQKV